MQQRESGLPFDDIKNLVKNLPPMDLEAQKHTAGQLGDEDNVFIDLCKWYSACSGRSPAIHRPAMTLFAGTHALENMLDGGDSSSELLNRVAQISEGSAYVNRLCYQHDVGLKVFDLALQIPVDDISCEPALDEKSCAGTIAFGMEAIAGGTDLLCVAALETKTTLSALAIISILGGFEPDNIENLSDEARSHLEAALSSVKGHSKNSLEVLRRLGGRETAAICGAILAARSQHIPVLIDGLTALAAALVLYRLEPSSLEHVKFAQMPTEKTIIDILHKIELEVVLSTHISNNAEEGLLIGAGVLKSACLLVQGRP